MGTPCAGTTCIPDNSQPTPLSPHMGTHTSTVGGYSSQQKVPPGDTATRPCTSLGVSRQHWAQLLQHYSTCPTGVPSQLALPSGSGGRVLALLIKEG